MKFRSGKVCAVLVGAMLLGTAAGCGNVSGGTASSTDASDGKDADVVKDLKKKYVSMVKLGEYKGVDYTPTDTTVTDDMVQNELNSLVSQYTTNEEITSGVATWGDAVNIDYTGYIDGEAFSGGDTQGYGTQITLGESGYIDNFDEQIVGHAPGDSFDVNVTFPDDYGNADLAGQPATFETTLNFIVGDEIIPDVTDDFISEATSGEYTNIDDYKAGTRASLEKEYTESGIETDKHSILQQVIDDTTIIEFPQQELEERLSGILNQYEEIAESYGMDVDTLLSYYYGYDAESFQSYLKESIESYMREKMVVLAVADAEGITASKEEYDAKVQELLSYYGVSDVAELNDYLGYTDEDYYFIILEEKITDFLYENATAVTE